MHRYMTVMTAGLLALALTACNSESAEVTTTTADAALLTTTTTTDSDDSSTTEGADTTATTEAPPEQVTSHEIISRQSTEDGETLYILVPPGDYSDVSFENFLGDLIADDETVTGIEVFDDRVALDASLKPEDERTAEELQALEDHHLVSLTNRREVSFQGPMTEYDDFVIGS